MKEAARLVKPDGFVLTKLQDQVVSGEKVWQRMLFANYAESVNLELVDELHVVGYRAQPQRKCKACDATGWIDWEHNPDTSRCPECGGSGKVDMVQKHSASNVSTLQVYRRQR
jgi:rubredoxin